MPATWPVEMPLLRGGQSGVNCHCKFNHSLQFAELQGNLIKRTDSDPLKKNVCTESITLQGQRQGLQRHLPSKNLTKWGKQKALKCQDILLAY